MDASPRHDPVRPTTADEQHRTFDPFALIPIRVRDTDTEDSHGRDSDRARRTASGRDDLRP